LTGVEFAGCSKVVSAKVEKLTGAAAAGGAVTVGPTSSLQALRVAVAATATATARQIHRVFAGFISIS